MCPNVHDDNMQCDRDPVRVVFWRGREEDDVVSAQASRTEPEDEMRRGGLNGGASEGTIGNIRLSTMLFQYRSEVSHPMLQKSRMGRYSHDIVQIEVSESP